MSDYTPSTEEIRNHLRSLAHLAGRDGDADAAMLDRWLAANNAEVARKAKAEAWDDGYCAGHVDARAVQPSYPEPTNKPVPCGGGAMTPEELEAIRERTEDDEYYSGVKHRFDAAALLAEVDRLRAEVVRLGRELTARGLGHVTKRGAS